MQSPQPINTPISCHTRFGSCRQPAANAHNGKINIRIAAVSFVRSAAKKKKHMGYKKNNIPALNSFCQKQKR